MAASASGAFDRAPKSRPAAKKDHAPSPAHVLGKVVRSGSGSMVRDMMLEAVEGRFAAIQAPHALEWLTDTGSVYTAHEGRAFATALNLVPCFTPIQSPESNGISESFVKTFKRDYVSVNPLPDAITALRQIAGWFLDYNENHPHSGLKMRSPGRRSLVLRTPSR